MSRKMYEILRTTRGGRTEIFALPENDYPKMYEIAAAEFDAIEKSNGADISANDIRFDIVEIEDGMAQKVVNSVTSDMNENEPAFSFKPYDALVREKLEKLMEEGADWASGLKKDGNSFSFEGDLGEFMEEASERISEEIGDIRGNRQVETALIEVMNVDLSITGYSFDDDPVVLNEDTFLSLLDDGMAYLKDEVIPLYTDKIIENPSEGLALAVSDFLSNESPLQLDGRYLPWDEMLRLGKDLDGMKKEDAE